MQQLPFTSIEDGFNDPSLLMKNVQEVWEPILIEALVQGDLAWRVEQLGRGSHVGTGMILREVNTNGDLTARIVRWHPGGGYHGSQPYWKSK